MTTAQIQQALIAAGYDVGPTGVDGKMGPNTKAAIKAYQQANGLAVDGIAGPLTQAKLGGTSTPASAATPAASQEQTFAEKYPAFAWAFSDPEVNKILQDGVANGWGPDEVQNAIQQTNWYKSKSNAERSWLQTLATDPADAARQLQNYDSITKYMGLAASYGIPASFQNSANQVARVVQGTTDATQLTEDLRNQAKALYPQLSQQIDAGSTVTDIYAPYQQMAVSLLGVNPATIDLTDPKWQTPLLINDGKGGKRVATTDEWQSILKTDPKYGYDTTSDARNNAAQFATSIGEKFGVLS